MQKKIALLFFTFFYCFFTHSLFATAETTPLTQRADVKAFIQRMVNQHHFDEKQLNTWFNQANVQPSIIASISKPAEVLPWHRYEAIFLTPQRIQEGAAFLQTHAKTLKAAQQKYGVPPEIIAAILGVETFYGTRTGQYNVLDSLITLGFDYPPRSKFFLSELEQFLLLARDEKWDPTQIKGSYAGAMGYPQFISSTYKHYAVDFNDNGKRDLFSSMDDAIGSIGHYFKSHGWQPNGLIALPATVKGEKYKSIIASKGNPKPNHSLQNMLPLGIHTQAKADPQHPFAFIALEGKNGPEYWLGSQNFYVITRYNHSDHYAMAVYNLSQEIKQAAKV